MHVLPCHHSSIHNATDASLNDNAMRYGFCLLCSFSLCASILSHPATQRARQSWAAFANLNEMHSRASGTQVGINSSDLKVMKFHIYRLRWFASHSAARLASHCMMTMTMTMIMMITNANNCYFLCELCCCRCRCCCGCKCSDLHGKWLILSLAREHWTCCAVRPALKSGLNCTRLCVCVCRST